MLPSVNDCIEFSLTMPDPAWTADTCSQGLPLHIVLALANKKRAFGYVTGVDESVNRIGLQVPGGENCGLPLSALQDIAVLEAVTFVDEGGHTYHIAKPTMDPELRVILRDYQECHLLRDAVGLLHTA